MKFRNEIILGVAALFAVGIIGCSSGGGNSSSNTGNDNTDTSGTNNNTVTTSKITIGAMTKGSVVLNGVHFDDSAAVITADDVSKTAAFLADGMTVKVKGAVNADGLTGIAEKIEVVDAARGVIATIGTDTLTINGQTVLVDGGTVLAGAGVTSLMSFTANDNIEVYGDRDDTGVIHATRVEKLAVAGAIGVRGAVSGKNGTTFSIGGFNITSGASTTMVPSGAPFNNGDIVDVRLNGNTAIQITVEHLDHPEFEPSEGQEFSVEGMLSGFSATSTFKVGFSQAQLGASISIDGGVLADLVDGVKVEAEGHTITGGILTAEKITIKDNIRLEANADGPGSANVLGKDVKTTSLTRLNSGLQDIASITADDGLRIRGFVNRDGSITATRVDKRNTVNTDEMIIQGPAKDINAAAHTLTIMGITVSAGSAIARPNDDSGTGTLEMLLDSFFSSLTADRTIVKAKGSFLADTLTASEIEIE